MMIPTKVYSDGSVAVLIHWTRRPSVAKPIGTFEGPDRGWHTVCGSDSFLLSDDPRAVTCSLCRSSDEFRAAAAEIVAKTGKVGIG